MCYHIAMKSSKQTSPSGLFSLVLGMLFFALFYGLFRQVSGDFSVHNSGDVVLLALIVVGVASLYLLRPDPDK